MKSGNLNFLEPSGPLQVCNGTDLPLYSTLINFFEHNLKDLQRKCSNEQKCPTKKTKTKNKDDV